MCNEAVRTGTEDLRTSPNAVVSVVSDPSPFRFLAKIDRRVDTGLWISEASYDRLPAAVDDPAWCSALRSHAGPSTMSVSPERNERATPQPVARGPLEQRAVTSVTYDELPIPPI